MPLFLLPFVGVELDKEGTAKYSESYEAYFKYLAGIRAHQAAGALTLAQADWHYDPNDFRCLKYASLHEYQMREQWVGGADSGRTQIDVSLKLKSHSARHVLHLRYIDVAKYELIDRNDTSIACSTGRTAHGQLLVDEFEFIKSTVIHHLLWNNQARWSVECHDIRFMWEPVAA